MKIALLGGVFNPPHLGHILIAQQVLDFTPTDEIWFLPNYHQSPPKPVAPVADRLAMTRLLSLPKAKVSTLEIDHQLNGQTINILPHLPKEHEFKFIIGSDQLAAFHLWGRWQELLQQLPFWVFPRYGYPNEPLYPGMTLVNDENLVVSNISSTKVRERVRRELPITGFVPEEVRKYIIKRGLYQ